MGAFSENELQAAIRRVANAIGSFGGPGQAQGLLPPAVGGEPRVWRAGGRVRIKSGALKGLKGTIGRLATGSRAEVILDLFSGGLAVEIDRDVLQPVSR